MSKKILSWFSCGVTSAIACKIVLEKYGVDNVDLYYIHIDSAHSDNDRFIADCEQWFGAKIHQVKSNKYTDQFDVIESTRFINGPYGAKCTSVLKKEVRFKLQREQNYAAQVFGFEYEKNEINRALRFLDQYKDINPFFPLIEHSLTKKDCAEILIKNKIELPKMYELGYSNNNCIGCVKGGKGYWNKIRVDFPNVFNKMAQLEREINRSCINGTFLDVLDSNAGKDEKHIMADCGSLCEIKHQEIKHRNLDIVMRDPLSITQLYLDLR